MIVASDLDRTLIFSPRRLDPAGPITVPVEWRETQPVGFMTQRALRCFQSIAARAPFFLNTLRGLEQANRVGFVQHGWCKYLALQNGLYLYREGREDTVWSAYVRRTVSALPLDLSGGIAQVLAALPGIQCMSKQYEYLAVFFVEEVAFDSATCCQLVSELNAQGWDLCRQGKKLYLFPLAIHKGAVLDRVRALEGEETVWGLGDSEFDVPMLRACQRAFAPQDSALWNRDWGFPIQFSQKPAQAGTQELLEMILSDLGEQPLC
ncbi:MAG: hypothetical protein HFF50_04015 [Lawsonibacter sp.]|nr:hypothetical protein [Lawsonibacter sp.]